MRTITLAVALALLPGPAVAQQQTFRNERGQITGSVSTSGNVTTFRDRSGRMTGTAERQRDGSVQYRDAMGRLAGSATTPRRVGQPLAPSALPVRWPLASYFEPPTSPEPSGC